MNKFLFVVIQAFVVTKCLGKHIEEYDLDDPTEEESLSISNELGDKVHHQKYNHDGAIHHRIKDSISDKHHETVRSDSESIKAHDVSETTEKMCDAATNGSEIPCGFTQKNDEDKSSTTLINYPFAVSIQRKAAHYTTGALIDRRWILSSGGEFFNVRESIKLFRARLGSVDCKRGGILLPLTRVEIHPSYVYGQPNFDLSLLRMAHPVEFTDFIHPISLSKIRTKVISAKFMTTYWPRVIIKGEVLPSTAKERIKQKSMRVSTQRLIPRSRCVVQMYDKTNATLHDSTLCLKPFVSHHSRCLPDSGAPIVAEDGLWGITSGWTSENCLSDPSPTVFSRVSSMVVKAWLDSLIYV